MTSSSKTSRIIIVTSFYFICTLIQFAQTSVLVPFDGQLINGLAGDSCHGIGGGGGGGFLRNVLSRTPPTNATQYSPHPALIQSCELWRMQEDEFMYCPVCEVRYDGPCPKHGESTIVQDSEVSAVHPQRAFLSLPPGFAIGPSSIPNAGLGVWTTVDVPKMTRFGPYGGIINYDEETALSGYSWIIIRRNETYYVDAVDIENSNWLRYVNSPDCEVDENLSGIQYRGQIYYYAKRDIPANSELLGYYGDNYAKFGLNVNLTACPPVPPPF